MMQGEGHKTDQWYYLLDEDDVESTQDRIEIWLNPDSTDLELINASKDDSA